MAIEPGRSIALWAVTPNGLTIARRLRQRWAKAELFCSQRLSAAPGEAIYAFARLGEAVAGNFHRYDGHVFIMAAGIVVRSIAPHLHNKTFDPAVVVVDDQGRFAISLLSGHLGGANALADQAAEQLAATAVITTASEVNGKAAIDVLAVRRGLKIENPESIKKVNMALLMDEPVGLHDPGGWLEGSPAGTVAFTASGANAFAPTAKAAGAWVWIDDRIADLPPHVLVLRPPSLVAGMGCNRNTSMEEIRDLLLSVLKQFGLSRLSLSAIATIDLKSDEAGLIELASDMGVALHFFSKQQLCRVEDVPTPSTMAIKHVGVPSVCEAAAILAGRSGRLIVPKHRTRNVTVAVARMASTSSA